MWLDVLPTGRFSIPTPFPVQKAQKTFLIIKKLVDNEKLV